MLGNLPRASITRWTYAYSESIFFTRVDILTCLIACSTLWGMPGYQLHKPIWQMSKNWFQSSSICQNSLQTRISLTLAPNRMERSLVMWCYLLGPRMIHENLSGFTGRFVFSFWLKSYIYLNPVQFMLVNNIVLILCLVASSLFSIL